MADFISRLILSFLLLVAANGYAEDKVQTGRYTVVNNWPTPSQVDLFAGNINMSFSNDIQTVGDALELVLLSTGYALASSFASDPYQDLILQRPLPEAHRSIGPMPIYKALETLVGNEFFLVTDNVHALVAFDLRPEQFKHYGDLEQISQYTPFNKQTIARKRSDWNIKKGQHFVTAITQWAQTIAWTVYWPDGKPSSVLASDYEIHGDFYSAVNTALKHLDLHDISYKPTFYEDSKTLIIRSDR